MAASQFLDGCRFNPTLGGTTDWTYSSAATGYNTPTLAGAVTATQYSIRAESADLSQWEISQGNCTITAGVPTFARTTVLYNSSGTGTAAGQSGAGTKISFSAVPQVAIVALKEDLTVTTAAAKSDQQTATSAILAVTPAHQQDHDSAVKFWVSFGPTGTILASYNVASVSRSSTGTFTISFTVPFATANYVVMTSQQGGSGVVTAVVNGAPLAGSCSVQYLSASSFAAIDPTVGYVSGYGRQ